MILPAIIGFLFGFFGAIPVAGPISALVLKSGLKQQYRKGRALAVGAGLAEAIYVLLAFWGFSVLLNTFHWLEHGSSWIAAALLIGLGIHFILSKNHDWTTNPIPNSQERKRSGFLIGFGISMVNPTLMATWTTVITSLHGIKAFQFSTLASIAFSIGVWAGISAWFSLMLTILKKNRNRIKNSWMSKLMLSMGILLIFLGLLAIRSTLS